MQEEVIKSHLDSLLATVQVQLACCTRELRSTRGGRPSATCTCNAQVYAEDAELLFGSCQHCCMTST
jgi:hypothetical protein